MLALSGAPLGPRAALGPSERATAQQRGDLEGQVEGLTGVQPGVAYRLVAPLEVLVEHLLAAAEALGDVIPGELHVHAAGGDVGRLARGEEAPQLAQHVVEASSLVPAGVHEGVAVHRVAGPQHRVTAHRDRPQQRGEPLGDSGGAHAGEQHQASGQATRVQALTERDDVVGARSRADLDPDRVVHPGEELHVGALWFVCPLTGPEQMRRAVVPVAGDAVAAGQRLLVLEQQCLVRRPHIDLVQGELTLQVDPAGLHEPQSALDLGGEHVVAAPLRAACHELLVPRMHARQIGEAALGEGPQQVHRRRRLVVCTHEPGRVRSSGQLVEREVVDRVAPERGQLDPVAYLGR